MYKSKIIGYGSYLPKKVITNYDLEKKLDTTNEWIVSRTGIEQRHIAEEGEYTSDLATKAAEKAIADAGIDKNDIDLIILGTCTPDETLPATAVKIQRNLGIKNGAAFDIQSACAGFIYALSIADNFIKAGQAKNVLVIGAETMSRVIDWNDRGTCILFGDGAGAVVLQASEGESGILYTDIKSEGEHYDLLKSSGGVSTTKQAGFLQMAGKEVFKYAVEKMSSSVVEGLEKLEMSLDDVDLLIPHQANLRIISSIEKKLNLPKEKTIVTLDKQANTSAATIPLALDYAYQNGKLVSGQIIALTALGGGFSWGSALIKL